jgi:hypothetical protein
MRIAAQPEFSAARMRQERRETKALAPCESAESEYVMRVMCLSSWARNVFPHVVVAFLAASSTALAQSKSIRLRTGVLSTPSETPRAGLQLQAESDPGKGLHLIQLRGPIQETWRVELTGLGVRLLRYVADDAFVVRLEGRDLGRVRALPYVHWLGPYRPEYRVDPRLRGREAAEVRVLLAPGAADSEAWARRQLEPLRGAGTSRIGTVLEGRLTAAKLAGLAGSEAVLWIEPAPRMRLWDEIASKVVGGDDGAIGTPSVVQQLGFDGSGVTVAVADSGLHLGDAETMHPDLAGRVGAFFYYGTLTDASDEHSHGTHVTGIIAGSAAAGETDEYGYRYGLGVTPGARIVTQRIFDGLGGYQAPPSFERLTRDAVGAGAEIGSNSWGDDTQGRYDLSAAEFDALVRDADASTPGDQPYILEFSAGNAGPGPQTIGSPAVAKNVIATGSSQNNRPDLFIYAEGQEAMADFSSRGPAEDGRIKPDLVAPGTWIASLKSAAATDENAWLGISENYLYMGGTSQAGPHVSGAAAAFVQYYRETHTHATPSPALVKAALINAAVDMDDTQGTRSIPNMDEGWGRVDLMPLLASERRCEFLDQTVALRTGESHTTTVVVSDASEPLRITLAYTDEPGFPGAIPALVNDLDLEIVGPDGSLYRGNQFFNGESVTDPAAADAVNNVEAVHLTEPLPGEYVVRVYARRVVADARGDTPEFDQDFALVVSGSMPLPGVGVLFFDRGAYRVPADARVKLIDADLAGAGSVVVQLASTTETNAESLVLQPAGAGGVFTNRIRLAAGTPVADGALQVADGDDIRAVYADASPVATRTALAVADFTPPVLSEVTTTNRLGKTVIAWTSDEPATSVVRYGTNGVLSRAVTNSVRVVTREVVLENLVPGQTYYFAVSGADEAGNASTNDNGGLLFTFVVVPAKTVLLVDAYVHLPEFDSTPIPVTAYTDALDQAGVSYEVWSIDETGIPSPTAADLRPFRVVIWRLNDSFWARDYSLTVPQQAAIQGYLDGGGAFLMASMEILSRLGDVPFRTNVLQAAEFIPNPDPFGGPCDTCDEDHGVPTALGEAQDPIGNQMQLALDYSLFPIIELEPLFPNVGPDLGDTFGPTTNAARIFTEPISGRAAGIRFPRTGKDSAGRVVFLSFPLEAVPANGPAPNNRVTLLRNCLDFLAPGVSGLASIALDRTTYTIPAQVTIEVADADLAAQDQVSVTCASDTTPNGVVVLLTQTTRPGLFRGSVTLVDAATPPAPGRLPCRGGDTLKARYADGSPSTVVEASALVDVIPAEISGVEAVPDYETAEVLWTTSEPTDALVQYGESAADFPNNRTAYRFDLSETHQLTLVGLRADRTYYYQVVVRDQAGNVTVDDNGGQFYTFRTLKPLTPPWRDDLEQGDGDWTVFTGEGSETTWELGIPGPGTGTAAFSPVNAWGSNLSGGSVGAADTFLISPAIDLTGGNVATLRFRQYYDFSDKSEFDIFEGGELITITGSFNAFTNAVYTEVSNGWEETAVDLTDFVGQVVFLVWHYQMFTFDFEFHNRPGWLLDDIEVNVETEPRGTLLVTNNLSQAQFSISGPVQQLGQGWGLTLTNLPLGEYVVTFDPVPFYQTPLPQTNLLTAGGSTVFTGVYRFDDANQNGMSDAWEQNRFNEISPTRTATTDTDQDGATDYAEFVAGTDPNNERSFLALGVPDVQTDGSLRFLWVSTPGRSYCLQGSENLAGWTPISDWVRATSTSGAYALPAVQARLYRSFRLEVRP